MITIRIQHKLMTQGTILNQNTEPDPGVVNGSGINDSGTNGSGIVNGSDVPNSGSETHRIVTTFLQKSFKPVRMIFPKQSVCYKNAIFSCTNCDILSNDKKLLKFNQGTIKIPCMVMAQLLIEFDDLVFRLEETENDYILDTMGRIPTRYCYMLMDFYFRDQKVKIDYYSKKSSDEMIIFWSNIVKECPLTILKNITMAGFKAAEFQRYKIQVFMGPPYSENREWFTKDHHHSDSAKEAWNRSEKLYSLGNIDQEIETKYRYYSLGAAEGGISMRYVNRLPWQPVRTHVRYGPFKFDHYVSSCGYTDTRGHCTYDQRKDLSVEEIVVLYEYLKSEGADVRVIGLE